MNWRVEFHEGQTMHNPDGSPQTKEIEADYWATGNDGFLYFRKRGKGQDDLPTVVAAVAQNAVKSIELVVE